MLDKPISHLWLHLTTSCNFECSYCYVEQHKRVISEQHARAAVRLLLDSPGEHKVLDLYGGEPLLAGRRLWDTIAFARSQAVLRGKTLAVKLATNGSLFRKQHIPWLWEAGIWVSLSIDGAATTHDPMRVDKNGAGTHAEVLRAARLLLEEYDPRRVMALMTVHPDHAGGLLDDVMFLHDEGFRAFHLNPVKTELWTSRQREQLVTGLRALFELLERRIDEGGEALFFEPVNQLLAAQNASEKPSKERCPLHKNLSVLPNGETAVLPDICYEDRLESYLTGPLEMLTQRFADCQIGSATCADCRRRYDTPEAPGMEQRAGAMRNRESEAFARRLWSRRAEPSVLSYIREARSRLFE